MQWVGHSDMNILSNVVLKFSHLIEQRILITAQRTTYIHTTSILLIMTLNVKNVCFHGSCSAHWMYTLTEILLYSHPSGTYLYLISDTDPFMYWSERMCGSVLIETLWWWLLTVFLVHPCTPSVTYQQIPWQTALTSPPFQCPWADYPLPNSEVLVTFLDDYNPTLTKLDWKYHHD